METIRDPEQVCKKLRGQFTVLTTDGAGVAAISILDKEHCC